MSRTIVIAAICLLSTMHCVRHSLDHHAADANVLTERYAASRFREWHIRATATGRDCAALVIDAHILLDESMIEAMHYGAGSYDTLKGGLKQFMLDHDFRGIVYKDVSGRVWTYDDIKQREIDGEVVCR